MTTPDIIPKDLREIIISANNITIERCAQVVEEHDRHAWDTRPTTLAAAIRELKEPMVDSNIVHPGSDHPGPFPEE